MSTSPRPRLEPLDWIVLAIGVGAVLADGAAIALLDHPAPASVACTVVLLPCWVFLPWRQVRRLRR